MSYRVCPAEGGTGKGLSVRCTPSACCLLAGGNIRHGGDKIETRYEMTFSRESDHGCITECRKRIEIEASPLGGESPSADKGLHEEGGVWLPFLTEESGILDSSVNNSQQGRYHLLTTEMECLDLGRYADFDLGCSLCCYCSSGSGSGSCSSSGCGSGSSSFCLFRLPGLPLLPSHVSSYPKNHKCNRNINEPL